MTRTRTPIASVRRQFDEQGAEVDHLASLGFLVTAVDDSAPNAVLWSTLADAAGAAAAAQAASQPLDATLTALAGLPTAADKVVYATGTDTFSTFTGTSFFRSIADDADAATVRATLGLNVATRNLHTNVTAAPSTATSLEETLYTYTLPGATLGTNKDRVEIVASGIAAATGTTKRIRLYFGATVLFDGGVVVLTGTHFEIKAIVYRTGAATQVAIAAFAGDTVLVPVTALETEPTETLSGDVIIKLTSTVGAGAAANDVIGKSFMVGTGASA